MVVFVFGTLLGPEATGLLVISRLGGWWWDFVSGFPAMTRLHALCVWGVWCGVVV